MAGALLAGAYTGPPELTLTRAFTSWTLDLPVLLAVLAAGGLYLAGVRRVRRAGQPWPAVRAVAFGAGGIGVLVLATMSFLGVYQRVLFWPRAVQTVLLLLAAPLFLALGRPLSLLIAALPRLGSRAEAAVGSTAARILTFPAITALVLVIVPFLLYFTSWYEAGLRSDGVRELTYLALLAPGVVFFWTLLRLDPVPKAYPYLVVLWVTGAEVVGDAILGLAIIADQHLIAGSYYQALGRPWGPSLRTDQVVGGGALWILGDIIGLPFLAAALIAMIREDEEEAAQVDAELDASAQAAASGAAVAPADGVVPADLARAAAEGRPWWESDPRFTGRFRGQQSGELSVGAPDQQGPAAWQVGRGDELMRLHAAPRGNVGPGGRVVGEHRDDRADRNLPDSLGEHDDRDGALQAEGVDGEHRRNGRRRGHGVRLTGR